MGEGIQVWEREECEREDTGVGERERHRSGRKRVRIQECVRETGVREKE